jgi:hypothetical protein
MASVEITYRYDTDPAEARLRPTDAVAARARLEAGNQRCAALLDSLESNAVAFQAIFQRFATSPRITALLDAADDAAH